MTLGRLVPFAAVASAGALNVFLMRAEEIKTGIDIFPVNKRTEDEGGKEDENGIAKNQEKHGEDAREQVQDKKSLGKSKIAAKLAVGETALSRVLNAMPVMVIPPLILVRLQQMEWLSKMPRLVLPVNLGMSFC